MRVQEVLEARVAENHHLENYLERNTTLPLGEIRMDGVVLEAQAKLAAQLEEMREKATASIRAAELMGRDADRLKEIERLIDQEQAALIEEVDAA